MRFPNFLMPLMAVVLYQSMQPAFGQSQAITDEAIPADIVRRLLSQRDFFKVQQLVLGQLPANFPTEFPLPVDAVIVAGVAYRIEPIDVEMYRVLLDIPQSPEALLDQYQVQLEASGWSQPEFIMDASSGFVSNSPPTDNGFLFCEDDEELSLSFFLVPQQDNLTGLDLNLFRLSEEDTRCDSETSGFEADEPSTPMPLLTAPAGAIVQRGGSSSSGRLGDNDETITFSENVGATIESELSAEAIAQSYAAQWEAAGWVLSDSNESDSIIQSFWTFEDETGNAWQGTLTIESVEEESGKYTASASVELVEDPNAAD